MKKICGVVTVLHADSAGAAAADRPASAEVGLKPRRNVFLAA